VRWVIVWMPHAVRQLKKLPEHTQRRILDRVDQAELDPFTCVKRLVGRRDYSLRAGDWRLLIRIVADQMIICKVVKRSRAYD